MPVAVDLRDHIDLSVASFCDPSGGMSSALVGPDSETFETLTAAEYDLFPELQALPNANFAFWVVMDGRNVLHAMRLSFPTVSNGLFAPFLVHDLIRSGQITASEITDDFTRRGFQVSQFISVESSFRVAPLKKARSAALPGYLGLTNFVARTRRSGVLAHQNAPAAKSMARAGLYSEHLALDRTIYTPSLSEGAEPDDRYWPVLLPLRGANEAVLERLQRFVPKHVETYIDLRPQADESAGSLSQHAGEHVA